MRSPVEPDLAAGDAAGRLEQADDRGAGQRLAGAGFADHAQHLAGRDVEARRRRPRRSVPRRVGNSTLQVARLRAAAACRCSHQRSFGLSASRSQSPSRLTDSTRSTSATPGKTVIHHSPENRNSLPTRISVPSEGCGRRHADAEEGQRRLGDDREAEVDRRDHQHRAQSRWAARGGRMMRERRQADHARRLHVLLVLLDHRRAAHGARVLHPVGERRSRGSARRARARRARCAADSARRRRRSAARSGSPGRRAARRRRA